ncbi:RdlA protein [Streptomyces albireticuli]|uniref:RdlA protein n=1 Tax=Streptomyces albireticuli TaxID=1940 RepID=A0A1Z2LCR0_9ACTN|nr:rodlin [Streptomyces albireticuli]ARZ72099.1 RdlA protein [Streptomyces albireticuli]
MLKKVLATVALTATAAAVATAPAMAVGDGSDVANGNGALTGYGNTATGGKMSPQMSAVSDSLNKLCIGVGKLGVQSLALLINVGVQDVPILTSQQQQQCTDNSTISDGDDPLAHLLEEISLVAYNGSGNKSGSHKH